MSSHQQDETPPKRGADLQPAGEKADLPPACEKNEVHIKGILMFGLALLVLGIVVHLLVWGMFYFLQAREAALQAAPASRAAGARDPLPPEPRLQGVPGHPTHPMEELEKMREEEATALSTYSWIDEKTGIVRVPIDEAMKLLLERGLPVRRTAESSEQKAVSGKQ